MCSIQHSKEAQTHQNHDALLIPGNSKHNLIKKKYYSPYSKCFNKIKLHEISVLGKIFNRKRFAYCYIVHIRTMAVRLLNWCMKSNFHLRATVANKLE